MFERSFQGAGGIINVNPVAVGGSGAGAFQSGESAQPPIEITAGAVQRTEAQDADLPVGYVEQQLFALQKNSAVAGGRFGRRLLIHPTTVCIAVHRTTAGVEDLTQIRQLWQQRLEAGEAVDEGVAVAVGIHLAISFGSEAEHGAAGLLQCLPKLVWIGGVAHTNPIGESGEFRLPFAAGGGQRQVQLRTPWLEPLSEGLAHITAANDGQSHG